jgi:hypothetical protein
MQGMFYHLSHVLVLKLNSTTVKTSVFHQIHFGIQSGMREESEQQFLGEFYWSDLAVTFIASIHIPSA